MKVDGINWKKGQIEKDTFDLLFNLYSKIIKLRFSGVLGFWGGHL